MSETADCNIRIKPEPYTVILSIEQRDTGRPLAWIELEPAAMRAVAKILRDESRRAAWARAKDKAAKMIDALVWKRGAA